MPNPPSKVPPRSKGGKSRKAVPGPRLAPTGNGGGGGGGGSRPAGRAPRPQPRRPQRGRSRRIIYGTVGIVVAAVIVLVIVLASSGGSGSGSPTKQAALNFTANGHKVYGSLGPEGIPIQVGANLAAANKGAVFGPTNTLTNSPVDGIQCNAGEQLAYHHHVHVAIFINGVPRSIPLGIGMVPTVQVETSPQGDFATSANCFFWLHVHAQDGIVHIESPEQKTFELGQFFDIWHQPLSSTQIGPYKGTVTATLNGQPWTGDPSQIPMNEHDQIVLNLGGPVVTPPPIVWTNSGL